MCIINRPNHGSNREYLIVDKQKQRLFSRKLNAFADNLLELKERQISRSDILGLVNRIRVAVIF